MCRRHGGIWAQLWRREKILCDSGEAKPGCNSPVTNRDDQ
jgi:hypothetical protein